MSLNYILTFHLLSSLFIFNTYSQTCSKITSHDAEGPYYTPNPPTRTDFTFMDPKSEKLFISGQVIDIETCKGVYAKIDFWNANSTGAYDNIGYNMRGAFYTDENGYYSLNTRLPGYFSPRPHHIHVKIWVHDINVLTTQLYFTNYGKRGGIIANQLTLIEQNTGEHNASFVFIVDNVPDIIQDTEPPEIGDISTTENVLNVNNTNSITSSSTSRILDTTTTKIYTTNTETDCCDKESINNEQSDMNNEKGLKEMKSLIISLSILGVLLIIAVGYVVFKNRKQKQQLERVRSTANDTLVDTHTVQNIGQVKNNDIETDDETATLR